MDEAEEDDQDVGEKLEKERQPVVHHVQFREFENELVFARDVGEKTKGEAERPRNKIRDKVQDQHHYRYEDRERYDAPGFPEKVIDIADEPHLFYGGVKYVEDNADRQGHSC